MAPALSLALLLPSDPCRDGAAALERRDFAAAEGHLRQCQTLQGHLMLAGVYQAMQKPDALYETSVSGIKKFPEEKRFYLTAGSYEARQKRYEAAITTLESAYKRWPDDPKLRSLLASSHFARGTDLLDAGKNEQAVTALKRATELTPNDVEAQMNLGRALHNVLNYPYAFKAFDKVMALNPSTPFLYFHRGMALHALGHFDQAIVDLTKEIETNPNYAPAHLVRGLAYLANGAWEQALPDLAGASRAMPDNASAHYGYGRTLIRADKLAEAETALRKAMAADQADPAPVNTLVSLLHRLGRADEARTLAAKAAELARARR